MESNEIIAVSTNYITGYRVTKVFGTVWGLTVRSRGIGGNVMAGLRSLKGGEIKEYITLLNDARNIALQRLKDEAKSLGSNAILDVRFDSSDFAQMMTEIVAYGTAVIVEQTGKQGDLVSLS
jgi:uncharacterized protein YbjQ (UPF0145 family)